MRLTSCFGNMSVHTLFAFLLTCLLAFVRSNEIYLREITIFTTHESNLVPHNTPEVYFVCDDDRQAVMLRDVTETERKYVFNQYQLPAAHLEKGQCVVCTLKEYDLFKDDDVFGTMKLCADSFSTGASQVTRSGEYVIRFECPQCIPKEEANPVVCATTVSAHANATASVRNSMDSSPYSSPAHVDIHTHRKGVSKGTMIVATLMGFAVGVIVGIVALKYFSNYRREQEATRMRELNAILQQEVPFEALPKPAPIKTTTVKSQGATYSQLPSESRDGIP